MTLAISIVTTHQVKLDGFKNNPEWFSKKELENCRLITEFKEGQSNLPPQAGVEDHWPAVAAAALACCDFTTLKRYEKVGLSFGVDTAYNLLIDRKPNFIDKWLLLALELKPVEYLELTRKLERDGIVTLPSSSVYLWAFVQELGQTKWHDDIVKKLSSDKELIEKFIWPLFDDQETMMKLMTAGLSAPDSRGIRMFSSESKVWSHAFVSFAERDKEFRKRLVPRLIDQLSRVSTDSDNKRYGKHLNINYSIPGTAIEWLLRILNTLKLSSDEVDQSVSRLVGILATKDGVAIQWSIEKLMTLDARQLPVSDVLGSIGGAFNQKLKDPAIKALELLRSIARADDSYRVPVSIAAMVAFGNKSVAVKERAVKVVEECDAIGNSRVRDELLYRMNSLTGLDKERLRALLASVSLTQADDDEGLNEVDLSALLEKAQALSGELAEAAGIADAVEYLLGNRGYIAALNLKSNAIPRLVPNNAPTPIDSLDDLIFLFLQILDGNPKGEQLEVALDGILRVCDQAPSDWDRRTSALSKQIDERFKDNSWGLSFFGFSFVWDMAGVARAWIRGDAGISDKKVVVPTVSGFFSARALGVAQQVVKRQSSLLLALPTHAGGFIDPRVLVKRLALYRDNKLEPDLVDVIQAILRLAPEYRPEALSYLADNGQEIESALAYALGDENTDSSVMKRSELWIAASRARAPLATDKLLMNKFGKIGPDGSVPAIYFQNFQSAPSSELSQNENVKVRDVIVVCPETESISVSIPTVSIHSEIRFSEEVLETLWPGNRESLFNYETRRMFLQMNNSETYRFGGTWESLLDPDTPLVGNASYLIGLAMTAKQPEVNRYAVDALIAAVEDGRLDGALFGIALRECWKAGVIMNRWVKCLFEVSKVSALHSHFVRQTIESFFSGTGVFSVPMLALWLDLCSAQGEQVLNAAARQHLETLSGDGKTAKLAQALLSKSENNGAHVAACGTLALRRRIERLERWQTSLNRTRELEQKASSVG